MVNLDSYSNTGYSSGESCLPTSIETLLRWLEEWKEIWYDIEEEGIKKAEEAYSSNLICDEKLNGVLKRFHDSLKIVKEQNEENAILN